MPGGALRRAAERIALPAYAELLRRATARGTKLQDFIDIAYHLRLGPLSIAPRYLPTELAALFAILSELQASTALELGSGALGTLYLLCRVTPRHADVIRLQVEGPPPERVLCDAFTASGQAIHVIPAGRDRTPSVRAILGDRSLDFLSLDGVLDYSALEHDLDEALTWVGPRGVVALHDICPGPPQVVGDVPRFWSEVKRRFRHRELIHDRRQGCGGIGLLYVGGGP